MKILPVIIIVAMLMVNSASCGDANEHRHNCKAEIGYKPACSNSIRMPRHVAY